MLSRRPARIAILVLSLAACGGEGAPTADQLFEAGAFPVGYRTLEVTYTPVGSSEPRTLPVHVWYPAATAEGEPASYSLSGRAPLPNPDGTLDAPEAAPGVHPLAVYSHGSGGEEVVAYPMCERLAGHGYVVVSPAHVGNTTLDALLGRSAPFHETALYRPQDLTAVLDALEADPSAFGLERTPDTSRTLVFGHSFGGYTTFAVGGATVSAAPFTQGCDTETSARCDFVGQPEVADLLERGFRDERVVAIAPQAPAVGLLALDSLGQLEVPTMLMSGRLDATTTQQEDAAPAWASLAGPDDVWVEMPEGAHFTFINICRDLPAEVLDTFRPDADTDGCGPDFIDPTLALDTLSAYLLGFAQVHIEGRSDVAPLLAEALDEGFVVTAR